MLKTLEFIDEKAVIDLTKRLVKNDSISGNERKIATLLAIEMKKAGFNLVQFDEQTNDIVGVMLGLGKGKTLVLIGYIDHVSSGSMENPYEGLELDGTKLGTKGKVIYGRGACDMKAALAAMISTGATLKRAKSRLKGNFAIIGLANSKSKTPSSIKQLLKKFQLQADYIVACPPTNLDIYTAHPGQVTFEIQAFGKMSNIGHTKKGDNAILRMFDALTCLQSNIVLPEDKKFGKANMIVSSIASDPIGQSHSIPNTCSALLARHLFDNENPETIRNEMLNILKKNNFKEDEVKVNVVKFYKPYNVDPTAEIVNLIVEAKVESTGKTAKIGQWTSGVNISSLVDVDIPVVGCGPGDEQFAHTPIEHVPNEQIIAATKIYCALAEKICVQMKEKTST